MSSRPQRLEREKFERGIRALRQIGLVPRFTDAIFTRTATSPATMATQARARGSLPQRRQSG